MSKTFFDKINDVYSSYVEHLLGTTDDYKEIKD